ncbi:hypothetical protein [Maribacter sp. LLG6340-A2]|uniref:hypothetical protein n=1 Tax=Maribacter sp. LLG6340-A2 TaxID=3160834 RepID=UPI003865AE0B
MKFYTSIFVLLFVFGCKDKSEVTSGKVKSDTVHEIIKNENDFHPLIDLILNRIHPTEVKLYKIIAEIDSTLIPRLTNYPESLDKRITDISQLSLFNRFKTKTSKFDLNTNKLNPKSRNLIRREQTGKDTLRIIFNSFLGSSKDSLVVTSIGFVYPKASGWEEIVFFEKKDSLWEIAKRFKTVDY